jgi:hypothetical protein
MNVLAHAKALLLDATGSGDDFMKSRLGFAVAAMLCVGVVSSQSRAGTIGPGDFGPNAVTETFDQLQVGAGFSPPLVLNGVSYFFSGGGTVIAYNPLSYFCVSGNCIATTATNAVMTITLDNPAERVGGYLGGQFSLPEATFYDANHILLGSSDTFTPLLTTSGNPAFFGFQSSDNDIKYIQIIPNTGQSESSLDNFTFEIVPAAAVPGPTAGTGASSFVLAALFLGWFVRRRAHQLV